VSLRHDVYVVISGTYPIVVVVVVVVVVADVLMRLFPVDEVGYIHMPAPT
jgi:hypothetical protein